MSEYSIYEKIRNEKGLRDADVSRGTGIATATLSEWKKGRYSPKQDKLEKIATFLHVPVEYLATGTVSSMDSDAAKIAQYVLDNNTVRLIVENIRTLNEKEREWVLEAIQFINKKKQKAPNGN